MKRDVAIGGVKRLWAPVWVAMVALSAIAPGLPGRYEGNVCLGDEKPRGGDKLSTGLIAHWPLAQDGRDTSGGGRDARAHGVDFRGQGRDRSSTAASFDGRQSWLEVPGDTLKLGHQDFSVAAWVYTEEPVDDLPGDIVSYYDARQRRGFHVAIKTNAGVTFTEANDRQLQFGIDQNRAAEKWTDCGRPGDAILAFGLCVHDGHLYAGTCEPGKEDAGTVYRYEAPNRWIDCGSPDRSNAVTALVNFQNQLYVGTGKYRLGGSALAESENTNLGGRIFRYAGNSQWESCGQLPGVEAIGGMVVYNGRLYASSLYKPAAFFRYDGGQSWTDCGVPDGKRVEATCVYNGHLYATCYDAGQVFRFDGDRWMDCGQLGDATENTQTYAFAVLEGRLYAGTWRTGRVYRMEEPGQWTDVGRLGNELEVMGMLVHNGRLIAGTLPSAEVYEFDGNSNWRRLAVLDSTPDVKYRRAWTMAEYQGRVFCSTLPSGKVFSWEAGRNVAWDRSFPVGWHHVAAVRAGGELRLYVDGQRVARSEPFSPESFDLDHGGSLRIGAGPNDYFCGRLSDVRLYGRALTDTEIERLAEK